MTAARRFAITFHADHLAVSLVKRSKCRARSRWQHIAAHLTAAILLLFTLSPQAAFAGNKTPNFVSFPVKMPPLGAPILPSKTQRHACNRQARLGADKVLSFVERSSLANQSLRWNDRRNGRFVLSDPASGWVLRKEHGRPFAYAVLPGSSDTSGALWSNVVDCTYIAVGSKSEIGKAGLPNVPTFLYYAPQIGLYLVKP